MAVVVILYRWYIQQKPSFTLSLRKIVLIATPRHQWQMSVVITGSPNAPPVLSPLFYAMAQSKICKYFKPRWQIESMTPFEWVSWLTEIFDCKSKSLPCFPPSWRTHYFWGKNEKYHKGRYSFRCHSIGLSYISEHSESYITPMKPSQDTHWFVREEYGSIFWVWIKRTNCPLYHKC